MDFLPLLDRISVRLHRLRGPEQLQYFQLEISQRRRDEGPEDVGRELPPRGIHGLTVSLQATKSATGPARVVPRPENHDGGVDGSLRR